ncbi:MAG: DUF1857 family protein [Mesosutterella sp.]|nr:DUF1857 family protein [Mesosutterella sp.]
MKVFSHSIELKGAGKSQSWEALEHFARHPDLLLPGCEGSEVHEFTSEDGNRWLRRVKNFGTVSVEDHVFLQPDGHLEIHVAASREWPRSWQEIDIEETAEGVRFRFTYSQETPQSFKTPQILQLRNEAYRNKDQGLVRLIAQKLSAA